MPEMRFRITWPDGTTEECYSPSLVIRDHFEEGEVYPLAEFMARARTSLTLASERVAARYGHPCSLALGQLARLESRAALFADHPQAQVACLRFLLPQGFAQGSAR
ncbi:MSMEG_0570 family nitrogen starvation response protein [Ancylobacter oerskovii]|uniref:MSMEG_0570 family nitrogen starvation response protein n=1 Tax=Ancylobacter oerskovii TaxID=459519 RepID=A0ABW4YZN8_9HYPH|nr:MSMEG_0570 family nitrogen starvation response protein [Ancylobacter oerskovii]MBS7541526.1 MSMEG_0570 family nitrogen starvation response protein [Ancylobacter oerskovii]